MSSAVSDRLRLSRLAASPASASADSRASIRSTWSVRAWTCRSRPARPATARLRSCSAWSRSRELIRLTLPRRVAASPCSVRSERATLHRSAAAATVDVALHHGAGAPSASTTATAVRPAPTSATARCRRPDCIGPPTFPLAGQHSSQHSSFITAFIAQGIRCPGPTRPRSLPGLIASRPRCRQSAPSDRVRSVRTAGRERLQWGHMHAERRIWARSKRPVTP